MGWKGPQEVFSLMSCSKQGHLWVQCRLLMDLGSWVLKIFNDRHCATSLGILHQSLTVLR